MGLDTKYMEEGPTRKELESVQEERDLGVAITADLKSSSQCIKSAAIARRVTGMVRINFRFWISMTLDSSTKLTSGHASKFASKPGLHISSKTLKYWKESIKQQQI